MLQEYLNKQAASVKSELFDCMKGNEPDIPQFWVAVINKEQFAVRANGAGEVIEWERYATDKHKAGKIIIYRNSCGFCELWMAPEATGWRKVYAAYLKDFHGIEVVLPRRIHVDHLFSRRRAIRFQLKFVRLGLVDGGSNMRWGCGVEKLLTGKVNALSRQRPIRKGTDFIVAKMSGIAPPDKKKPIEQEINRIAEELGGGWYLGQPAGSPEIVRQVLKAQYQEVFGFRF